MRRDPEDRGSPVAPCGCEGVGVSDSGRLESLGVPRRLSRSASFESFEELTRELGAARRKIERWAEAWPDVHEGLFLTGSSGVGKTHLAVAAIRRVVVERKLDAWVRFVYVPELVERLRWTLRDREASEDALLEPLFEAEILVLDNLGENMMQEWVVEKMLYILTRCYNNDRGTLVCTSVFDAEGTREGVRLADKITERGVSRLREACQFVDVRGEDYRDTVIRHGVGL